MRVRGIAVAVLLCVAVVGLAAPARADEYSQDTGRLVSTKFFRGVVNLVTGWMEIPKQMSLTWQEKGPAQGMSLGFAKGLGWAVGRTAVGAYEIVTFPFPIPEEYRPIMQPEYVLSDLPQESPHPTGSR